MRGTKRSADSESAILFNSNDSSIQSKRVIMGSPFIPQTAEPSIQLPPLDMKRAESSRQHVRALNTQFASWVQAQLQKHPDELWDDGVEDYLKHSRSIMEKYSDIVDWLKANASKAESSHDLRCTDTLIKPTPVNDKNSREPLFGKPLFTPVNDKNSHESVVGKPMFAPAATPISGSSWGSNSNTTFTFGGSQVAVTANANSLPPNHGASNDADGDDDVEQPSSPSVKKSEEKGISVVHEVKCKLYVKSTDPADKDAWKDKGIGQLSIKCKEGFSKGTKESKPTIVIRNDVGKLSLNALLYPGIKINKQKNSVVAIFHTADSDKNDAVVARTFLIKTKNEEERDKLAMAIQEHAPAA